MGILCLWQLLSLKARSPDILSSSLPDQRTIPSLLTFIGSAVLKGQTPLLSEQGMCRVASAARNQLSNFQHEASCEFLAGRSQCGCGWTSSIMQSRLFNPDVPSSLSAWWCQKGMQASSELALSVREVTQSLLLLLQPLITFSIKDIILSAGSTASLCACQAQQPSLSFLSSLWYAQTMAKPSSCLHLIRKMELLPPLTVETSAYHLGSISQALFHFHRGLSVTARHCYLC